jgi:putative NAD(P)-binding protein
MHELREFKSNDRVAVIGAGAAGLAAAAALRSHGCTVDIFEAKERPLELQRETSHRYLHPTINFWPMDAEYSWSANIPFFEWYSGLCHKVVFELQDRWDSYTAEHGSDLNFIERSEVRELDPVAALDGQFRMKVSRQDVRHYNTAIVATGFEDEQVHLDLECSSYWEPDALEASRDKERGPNVISGFGDGGLIDALRLAYDFDHGKLSFKLVELIDRTNSLEKVRKCVLGAENLLQENQDGVAKEYNEAAKLLADNPEISDDKTGLLKTKLHYQSLQVMLVDKNLNNPFLSSAAPVHKLMLAFAKFHGAVDWKKSELSGYGGSYSVEATNLKNIAKQRIAIRHGARPKKPEFLTDEEWDSLARRSEQVIKYSYKPAWEDGTQAFPSLSPVVCKHSKRSEYVEFMRDAVDKAFRSMDVSGCVDVDGESFIFWSVDKVHGPAQMFGIPIQYKHISEKMSVEELP